MGMAMAGPMLQGAGATPAPQSPPPAPPVWHITQNGQSFGPYSHAQLAQAAADQRLRPESLVWTAGMENWTAANRVPALAGIFPASPPPPPPPSE
jgi:hypothetical protein